MGLSCGWVAGTAGGRLRGHLGAGDDRLGGPVALAVLLDRGGEGHLDATLLREHRRALVDDGVAGGVLHDGHEGRAKLRLERGVEYDRRGERAALADRADVARQAVLRLTLGLALGALAGVLGEDAAHGGLLL